MREKRDMKGFLLMLILNLGGKLFVQRYHLSPHVQIRWWNEYTHIIENQSAEELFRYEIIVHGNLIYDVLTSKVIEKNMHSL